MAVTDVAMEEQEPLYHFSSEAPVRPRRSVDYTEKYASSTHVPIVVDNGSYHMRVGWANEPNPRYDFRNLLSKPRSKSTGHSVNIVGDSGTLSAKLYDISRASSRSAFDSNVVVQFETMETVLDHAFDRLGLEGGSVAHPLFITECPCNPLHSRTKMAELAFEAYGVPSLAFGVDSVLAFSSNLRKGVCGPDGLLVSAGHSSTHVIPMVGGQPLMEGACRSPVGGFHSTNHLKSLLALLHPQHTASLGWERVEEMKRRQCYVAEEYSAELRQWKRQKGSNSCLWQLPWVAAPPLPQGPTEEEVARRAGVKEAASQRLKDMAAAKRAAKVGELEGQVAALEGLAQRVKKGGGSRALQVLRDAGLSSREELESQLGKLVVSLRKAQGEVVEEEEEKEEVPDAEKYPLLTVADSDLTPDQVKEKRRQRLLKNAAEGRARAKLRRDEVKAREAEQQRGEEQRWRDEPDAYLAELSAKFSALRERVEKRKQRKSGGGGGVAAAPGGRGERLTSAHRERMKLLTTAAFDNGKGNDTFGASDEDWQLYKKMGAEEDEEGVEEEEAEYKRVGNRLQQLDPTFVPPPGLQGAKAGAVAETPQARLTETDFQIRIGVERIRAAEVVFQPSILAVDQAGIAEMLSAALRRTPQAFRKRVAEGGIFVTGGSSLVPGTDARLLAEMRKIRPLGADVKVVRSYDPVLDTWHGAAALASSDTFAERAFSKIEYEEKGADWLRTWGMPYSCR